MVAERGDFYKQIRAKVNHWLGSDEGKSSKWASYALLAPDFVHLIVRLLADSDVPMKEKAKLGAVLAYFVSPVDVVPDVIAGQVGVLDDVALAAYALQGVLTNTDPEVLRRHWAGDQDLLTVIQEVLGHADKMLGFTVWNKLRKLVA